MRWTVPIALILVLTAMGDAQQDRTIPVDALDYTVTVESNPLPKYLTPAERRLPIDKPTREDRESRTPPMGKIYCPPEYAYNQGIFLAWEGYSSILKQMTVGITTSDPEAIVYIVVDSAAEQRH